MKSSKTADDWVAPSTDMTVWQAFEVLSAQQLTAVLESVIHVDYS